MAASIARGLLFPAKPVPWSSLIGMVSEAARDNVHRSVAPILRAAGYPHHAHYDLATSRPELLPRLAGVLGLEEEEVVSRSHPPVDREHGWGAEMVDFSGAPVWRYDLDFRRRRVACAALAGSPHHRALWTHALVPWCIESGDWLIEACPSCGARLRWHRAVGIAACDHCRTDLRAFAGDGPGEDVRHRVDPVLALLSPDPVHHGPALGAMHEDLRGIGRGAAFELGWRLAGALGGPAGVRPRGQQHKLERGAIVGTLMEAAGLLRDWPHAVDDRLDALGAAGRLGTLTATIERLRRDLHRRRTWPEIARLLETRSPAIFTRAPGTKSRRIALERTPGLVDGAGAHVLLGTGSRKFAAIHRGGLVSAVTASGDVNRFLTFREEDLQADAAELADRLPMATVRTRLGATAGGVEQLERLGGIRRLSGELLRSAYPTPQASRASFEEFERLLERAARQDAGAHVPLGTALGRIGGREKPYGPVLLAMSRGELPFSLRDEPCAFTRRALLRREHTSMLDDYRFEPPDLAGSAGADTIDRKDAADVLNVAPARLMRILAAELAGAGRGGLRLDRETVVRLAAARISAREIMQRWCDGERRLPPALDQPAPLRPLGPAGWDRSAVIARMAQTEQ